jgi:predicted NBD/HSP70 family sugar kinase
MPRAAPLPSRALVADIGGTNARFAVADLVTLELTSVRYFPCSDHPTLAAAVVHYLGDVAESVDHAAVAGAPSGSASPRGKRAGRVLLPARIAGARARPEAFPGMA